MPQGNGRLVLATAIIALCSATAAAQPVAISAGLLIDPDTGEQRRNQTILVEGTTIAAIGDALTIPPGATRIDLSKETVLPGLIDAHTHLLATVDPKWDLGDFWIMALQRRAGYRAAQGVRYAREMLESGFTTVRDVGNAGEYLDADLEKAIRFGIVPGPTMVFAGRIIAPFGGQFWDTPANPEHLKNPEYYFADSQDELRKAVRENIYWGARVIKLVVDGQRYRYSTEDIQFVVAEARGAGVPVAAHVQTDEGARAAVQAGVASIEHGWALSDETLAIARSKRVALVGTEFTPEALVAAGMTPERAKETYVRRVARLKRVREAGVTVVFGTDVMSDSRAKTRGQMAIGYIDSFVAAGYTAKEILQAMTTRAASLLGVASERGTLRAGLAADLVATPTNPMQDIQGLKRIDFVMKNGTVYRKH